MTNKHTLAGMLLGGSVALAALAALAALTACAGGDRSRQQDDALDIAGPVAALAVVSQAGDVEVTASDRDSVRIVRTLRWRGSDDDRPLAEHTVSGDRLELRGTCAARRDGCAVDYRIEVPRDLRVDIDVQAGDLSVHGLSGELAAVTGAGDIRAQDLSMARVRVNSGAGDIKLTFAAAPQQVGVDTGSGDVTVHLPAGPYRVTAGAQAGDRIVDVRVDDAATRSVIARSGAGDVRLLPV